jgi:hypothetical protein
MMRRDERELIWSEMYAFADCMTQAKVHFATVVDKLREIDERDSRKGNRKSTNKRPAKS